MMHTAIYVTNNKDGKEYGSMNPQTQTDAVFAQAHKEALSSKPEDNLDDSSERGRIFRRKYRKRKWSS